MLYCVYSEFCYILLKSGKLLLIFHHVIITRQESWLDANCKFCLGWQLKSQFYYFQLSCLGSTWCMFDPQIWVDFIFSSCGCPNHCHLVLQAKKTSGFLQALYLPHVTQTAANGHNKWEAYLIPFSRMLTVPSGGCFFGGFLCLFWFGFGGFVRCCLGFFRAYGYCLFKEGQSDHV